MVKERNIVWFFNCSFIPICAPQNGNISDRQTDQRDGCLQLILFPQSLIVQIIDCLNAIFHIMCMAGMGVVMMFVLHSLLSLVEVTVQVFLYATGLNS